MAHFRNLNILPKFFVETGSHRASVKAVAQGKIDFAAIDAQSWRLIKKYDSFVSNVKVLGHTNPSPGLPFITSKINLRKNLFHAIKQAVQNLQKQYRSVLYLNDFVTVDENKYLVFEN